MIIKHDVIIIGAGGAGLRAALELGKDCDAAVITKLHPTRSHTGTAQGGICAALGNEEPDSWEWHMYDTVKGSDYLGDQDAIEVMCYDAVRAVYELEHMGVPFSRTPDGRLAQRPFGGHTREHGKAAIKRACFAADRTGLVMLHAMYEQCLQNNVRFYNEYFAFALMIEDGVCRGVVAGDMRTGEIHRFHAKAVLLATGGLGKAFKITSNAYTFTGDGMAIAYKAGIPLEDMEFIQFHPTGLYRLGILMSEAARGEGAVLRNKNGERFMERYAPTVKDLAPRDLISRAILTEIEEGRGIDGKDYVTLDLTGLPRDVIEKKLPDITGFARIYLGVDPVYEPVPIQPTCHYAMGGVPTDSDGRVVSDEKNTPVHGLYAAGECACVSVHGANRLGSNSLLDLVVFGRRAGAHIAQYVKKAEFMPMPKGIKDATRSYVEGILKNTGGESVASIREALQTTMMANVGVFRTKARLEKAKADVKTLIERFKNISIVDKGGCFNFDFLEAVELDNLLTCAQTIVEGALARAESRGAHYREDFTARDDKNWLKHTFAFKDNDNIRLAYKPVVITRFEPKERKY